MRESHLYIYCKVNLLNIPKIRDGMLQKDGRIKPIPVINSRDVSSAFARPNLFGRCCDLASRLLGSLRASQFTPSLWRRSGRGLTGQDCASRRARQSLANTSRHQRRKSAENCRNSSCRGRTWAGGGGGGSGGVMLL